MSLEIGTRELEPGATLVEPIGELEVFTASELRTKLESLTSGARPWLVVSLEKLSFMDSKGIGVLVAATRRARERGGDLIIICTNPRYRNQFQILQLEPLLALVSSEREARERIAATSARGQDASTRGEPS